MKFLKTKTWQLGLPRKDRSKGLISNAIHLYPQSTLCSYTAKWTKGVRALRWRSTGQVPADATLQSLTSTCTLIEARHSILSLFCIHVHVRLTVTAVSQNRNEDGWTRWRHVQCGGYGVFNPCRSVLTLKNLVDIKADWKTNDHQWCAFVPVRHRLHPYVVMFIVCAERINILCMSHAACSLKGKLERIIEPTT